MPLYEYRCSKCDKTFEVIRKFSDAPIEEHEGCGGKVERLITAPSFHLKGSGWYATDYAKPAKPSAETSAEEKGAGDKSKDASAADGKPADGKTPQAPAESKAGAESKSESKTESKPAAPATKSD